MKRAFVIALGAGVAAGALYTAVIRPWQLGWGADSEETAALLPGDELIPEVDLVATRAITIRAPARDVWPWIVQLGQGRGGLYSYDALENIVGCEMQSAAEIKPECQSLRVGDEVKLHPDVPLQVAAVEPGNHLVLRGGVQMGDTPPPYDFTWAFVLRRQADGNGTTRLVVRERYGYTKGWAPLLVEPVEAVSFVMSQKMLRGIRDRAEGRTVSPAPAPPAS